MQKSLSNDHGNSFRRRMQILPLVWQSRDLIKEPAATRLLVGQEVIVRIIHGQ